MIFRSALFFGVLVLGLVQESRAATELNRPMSGYDQGLYNEVKSDIQRVVDPLFPLAKGRLDKTGSFLPFGSTLTKEGKVQVVAAYDGKEIVSSKEVLPMLHDSLRNSAKEGASIIAVCEWVTLDIEGKGKTQAIKVLVEHNRGLTVAFYLPVHKPFLRNWQVGEMFVKPASPEIKAWAR